METLVRQSRVLSRKENRIRRALISCAERRDVITYKGLAGRLKLDIPDMALRSVFASPLEQVNQWCRNRGTPLLASLVVRGAWSKTAYQPGPGFWKLVEEWGIYYPIDTDDKEQRYAHQAQWLEGYHERVYEFWGSGIAPYNG